MTGKQEYWAMLMFSLAVAFVGYLSPAYRMPLDYDAVVWRSIPAAAIWAMTFVVALWRFKARGLWLLLGVPMAVYWPAWLIFNHFPPCYYSHNCV